MTEKILLRDGTKKLCFSKDTNAKLGNANFQIYANIEYNCHCCLPATPPMCYSNMKIYILV